MISDELKDLLEQTESVERTYAEIDEMEWPSLENDPEFIADVMKGQLVEDILTVMEKQNINKNQLADLLNMSRQYVGRILNETANFTVDSIAKIACALNQSVQIKLFEHDEILDVKKVDEYRMSMRNFKVTKFPKQYKEDLYASENPFVQNGGYHGEKELKFVS